MPITKLLQLFALTMFSVVCIAQPNEAKVIDAVVNIHVNQVRAWDDSYNNATLGTGFVIDAEQGLILSNKHIVETGPVVAYAEFSNKKQIELIPIYRDPVHDFGVFKYDPDELDGLIISAIELNSEASVGSPIRLYGNDGGEDLSIIEGVLSRIDRPAPDYRNTNTDFNTFYYQAALGSSGGSSGSPILNSENQAIAINAGARRDADTAFFLPMQMIIPTVEKLRHQRKVTRGTLQTEFSHTPFNRLRTLGMDEDTVNQQMKRAPGSTGKLVVSHVLPQGPADGVFEPGDILLSINLVPVSTFFELETLLNGHVNKTISVSFYRNGDKMQREIKVNDLFALTPSEFIEYGNASIIPVGINLARLFNIPVKGVTLADAGPLFGSQNIKRFALIEEINNQAVNDLDDVEQLLSNIAVGAKFSVRYRYPFDVAVQQYKQLTDYTDWFDNQRCKNINGERHWQCKTLHKKANADGKYHFDSDKVVTSPIVDINVFRPVLVNSQNDVNRRGQGAIVDRKAGLILTDKSVIDSSLAMVNITFNNGVSLPATVVAVHPFLNLAMIKTDLSGVTFKENILPVLDDTQAQPGQPYHFIGKSSMLDFQINAAALWPIVIYNEAYHDSFEYSPLSDSFGLYLTEKQKVVAVNTHFEYDDSSMNDIIPASLVMDFVHAVKRQKDGMYILESNFSYTSYADALELGIEQVKVNNTSRVVSVYSVESLGGSNLLPGDIILKVNDKSVSAINQIYNAIHHPEATLSILRNGKVQTVAAKARFKDFNAFHDVVFWGGAVIHKVDDKVNLPEGPVEGCLRISVFYFGSPVHSSGITNGSCIYAIDGKKVQTIDDIVNITQDKEAGDYTRVQTIEMNNNFRIAEFRLREDPYYWPIKHWSLEDNGWQRESN
ncbi:trypsin-like peptidase domain-containing protein [Neptunicella marina]|uniref:PDZ domain-containing protein n=1 Tax=Neptunicella marina TaxID=2125989 RepID=A0A8J6IPF1_9ALTE|nr:trypsin-like peptidase domain-containing protein [Neptunicella marina]MBC3764344.1 PDZ domain-containing protein [Neptunicella marina]